MLAVTALPTEPGTSELGASVHLGLAETVTDAFLSTIDHVFERARCH